MCVISNGVSLCGDEGERDINTKNHLLVTLNYLRLWAWRCANLQAIGDCVYGLWRSKGGAYLA